MLYLQGQRVLVLGLGVSGLSMARWCVRCGAVVRVADTRENPPGLEALRELVPGLEFLGGSFNADVLLACADDVPLTRVLISPGLMKHDEHVAAVIRAAGSLGVAVQGELNLFAEAIGQIDLVVKNEAQANVDGDADGDADGENGGAQVFEPHIFEQDMPSGDIDGTGGEDAGEADAPLSEDSDIVLELTPPQGAGDAGAEPDAAEFIPPVVVAGYTPKVIAVTGTNGKTTVTSLTAQLVACVGRSVVAAGNIGLAMMDALSEKLDEQALPDVWVLELSSFQLDGVEGFDPSAAVILNLSQDHLDWHGSMQNYVQAKGHIFGEHTVRVLNREDDLVMAFRPQPVLAMQNQPKRKGRAAKAVDMTPRVVTFGLDVPAVAGDLGVAQDGGIPWLVQAQAGHETLMHAQDVSMELLMPVDALRIRGRHNAANALASLALATAVGCEIGPMLFGLRNYRGEPHRVESVAIVNGVEYFDDSKGTNVGATAAAISGLGVDHKVVVILGGDGKGQDFSPLQPLVQQYVRAVVLIGRDAKVIEAALQDAQVLMMHAGSMDEAVQVCAQQARSGDVVLMSPACASWDMFKNYEHRAQAFIDAVHTLAQDQGQVTGGWQ